MAHTDILQQIKLIMRRDLKLQPNRDIPDDMPLVGSDMDLDSLDVLLLVSSVEKEFKIKISSEAMGQSVFQSLATLTAFIGEQLESKAAAAPSPDYMERLPHAEPFRFVSRVTLVREGELAEGVWRITGEEPFLKGHFPGHPIVPGVLIAEALAQISGLALPSNSVVSPQGKLAHMDVRFDQPVVPPAEITLKSRLQRTVGELHQFEVTAMVGDVLVARGSVTLHRAKAESPVASKA